MRHASGSADQSAGGKRSNGGTKATGRAAPALESIPRLGDHRAGLRERHAIEPGVESQPAACGG